ncbi:MAG: 4Fe-4S dicluster domain-containing protein [Thermodesulfobacteriota bacterium]
MNRREFLKKGCLLASSSLLAGGLSGDGWTKTIFKDYDPAKHFYGMGIDINKCIGCGRCMQACKTENDVPAEPYFFRTWVERYLIRTDKSVTVRTISLTRDDPAEFSVEKEMLRSFFVPKLCNQCDHPPCVQVCPVIATFKTPDGVTLVDEKRCIGCRYCIQACPYGARYLHPVTRVADKCTFCYHRLVKGLLPVCVEVCPKQARLFGDMKSFASPLGRFTRIHKMHVLKPSLNTDPKVYYANLDGEVN